MTCGHEGTSAGCRLYPRHRDWRSRTLHSPCTSGGPSNTCAAPCSGSCSAVHCSLCTCSVGGPRSSATVAGRLLLAPVGRLRPSFRRVTTPPSWPRCLRSKSGLSSRLKVLERRHSETTFGDLWVALSLRVSSRAELVRHPDHHLGGRRPKPRSRADAVSRRPPRVEVEQVDASVGFVLVAEAAVNDALRSVHRQSAGLAHEEQHRVVRLRVQVRPGDSVSRASCPGE